MSNLTQQFDDDDLIEELKKYGENFALSAKKKKSSKANNTLINDDNRDIYLKKLNHYRAREKAETNPSKQYLKQQQHQQSMVSSTSKSRTISGKYRLNDEDDDEEDDDEYEEERPAIKSEYDNDVIELTPQDSNQSEYVQVSNAHTSPLSMSTFYTSTNTTTNYTHNPLMNPKSAMKAAQAPLLLENNQNRINPINNFNLKQNIGIERTLSKYRSEINTILSKSIVSNRNSSDIANKYLNENKSPSRNDSNRSGETVVTQKTIYCPKPASTTGKKKTFLQSLASSFYGSKHENKQSEDDEDTNPPYHKLSLTRDGNLRYRGISENKKENLSIRQAYENNHKQINQQQESKFKQSFWIIVDSVSNLCLQLSKILPYLLIIIFTVIVLQYVRIKVQSGDLSLDIFRSDKLDSVNEKIVGVKEDKTPKHLYCDDIKDTQCSDTKTLIREIIDYLRYRSGFIECSSIASSSSSSPIDQSIIDKSVHVNQIIRHLSDEKGLIKNKLYQQEALNSILNAIQRNPYWNLRLLNGSYSETDELDQVKYIYSLISSKPLMCRFKELVHFLYVRVIMLGFLTITIALAYLLYKQIMKINNERDKYFYYLIGQVTNMVEKQYEMSLLDPANIKPYIAISHIFDSLIDPSERAGKKKIWTKVVKFIEEQESRIHLETQFIDGEETLVWKWAVQKHAKQVQKYSSEGIGLANSTMIISDPMSPNSAIVNSKSTTIGHVQFTQGQKENFPQQLNDQSQSQTVGWQGDAFNKSEKQMSCPTPCLKIRNMFDSQAINQDQLLEIRMHNDILEKFCAKNYGNVGYISHISFDKKNKEGIVYLKCSTNEAAGRIYQLLNGTWYNSRLLNVKFLRSDRYLERFPESVNYIRPLQPISI